MTKQPSEKSRKSYVTVEEAALLLNVVERTVRRWIVNGTLHVIRDGSGFVYIDQADIDARNAKKPHQPHPILARQEKQERQIDALYQRIEQLEAILHQLEEQRGEQLHQEGSYQLSDLYSSNTRSSIPSSPYLSSSEKRGLPPNTVRLVDFARHHQITVGTIRALYYQQVITVEIYKRSTSAVRNKQEWWVTPEQHRALIRYLEEQKLAYTPCPMCEE